LNSSSYLKYLRRNGAAVDDLFRLGNSSADGPELAYPNPKVKEMIVLTSPRSRVTIGPLDIPVDIGVPAEKEVIQ
jgi:hypothetical protein